MAQRMFAYSCLSINRENNDVAFIGGLMEAANEDEVRGVILSESSHDPKWWPSTGPMIIVNECCRQNLVDHEKSKVALFAGAGI